MKPIEKDEIFNHLHGFLKDKGVQLAEGSYTQGIRMSCSFLTDAINLGQEGLHRARHQFDKAVHQMRQAIHHKTAPKPAPRPAKAKSKGTNSKAKSSRRAKRA